MHLLPAGRPATRRGAVVVVAPLAGRNGRRNQPSESLFSSSSALSRVYGSRVDQRRWPRVFADRGMARARRVREKERTTHGESSFREGTHQARRVLSELRAAPSPSPFVLLLARRARSLSRFSDFSNQRLDRATSAADPFDQSGRGSTQRHPVHPAGSYRERGPDGRLPNDKYEARHV